MKKNIITLLLAVSASFVFSASVMAADENKANGFYDIGEDQNVELTVFSGDDEVSATEKDVDGDGEPDQWYKNSNKIGATYTAATEGAYYSIIMVEGRGLPTKDSEVFYINQETANSTDIGFRVGLKELENTTDMSLYIASNAKGFKLVNIPLSYVANVDSYTPGDVNNDGKIDTSDIISTRRFITGGWGVSIIEEAADVDADSKHSARDVILMRRFVAGGYNVELK